MKKRIQAITKILDEKKGENIEVFNVGDKGYLVDVVIIATSLNSKHAFALLDYLKENLKSKEEFLRVDEDDNWIIADLGDILIHLMTEEYRKKYCIDDFLQELTAKHKV